MRQCVGVIPAILVLIACGQAENGAAIETGKRLRAEHSAVTQVVRPPSVPSDAMLVTGAQRIRQMLLGKRLQPVRPETSFDQGDEFFRSDRFWEKLKIGESPTTTTYLGLRIDWRDNDYCVYYLATKRCTSLLITNEGKMFASHNYSSGRNTSAYEVLITGFNYDKVSINNNGINK